MEINKTQRSITSNKIDALDKIASLCIQCECSHCERTIQRLQMKVVLLEDKIKRLEKDQKYQEYNEKFKQMALEKREGMMIKFAEKFQQENLRSSSLEKDVLKLNDKLKQQQDFTNHLLNGAEINLHGSNPIQFRVNSKLSQRRFKNMVGEENQKRFIAKSMNAIKNSRFEAQKQLDQVDNPSLGQLIKRQEVQNQLKIQQQGQTIVSLTQGSRLQDSFFTDKIGKFSFFQCKLSSNDEAQREKILKKIDWLQEFFKDETQYTIQLDNLHPSIQRQNQIGVCIQYSIKDLKHFIQIGQRLKSLLAITTTMIRNINLNEAFQSIINLTCTYLSCDRVYIQSTFFKLSIFIVDKQKSILWTKAQKSSSMIEVPIDKGLVGYSVLKNQIINVENAYKDERFYQEIDRQTGYKTKSVLVVPVKDEKGNITGALQAINKSSGSFSHDDEDMLIYIAAYTGGIIKNSLLFEDAILKYERSKKLLDLAIKMYQFDSIDKVISYAQKEICQMMGVQRCKIYLLEKIDAMYILKQEQRRIVISGKNSFLSQAVIDNEVVYARQPRQNQLYNPQIDIDTMLPLITLPIFSQDEQILGVIQVEAIKAFVSEVLGNFKEDDLSLLKLFANTLGSYFGFKKI